MPLEAPQFPDGPLQAIAHRLPGDALPLADLAEREIVQVIEPHRPPLFEGQEAPIDIEESNQEQSFVESARHCCDSRVFWSKGVYLYIVTRAAQTVKLS
jgi:hypothetical protein